MENLNLFLQPKADTAVIPIEDKRLLTADKSDLSCMASLIVEAVDDGYSDALDTLIMGKKMEYVAKSIVEGMKGKASIPEGKEYSKHSCALSERATGVKYFFDGCNDLVWNELSMQFVEIQAKMKDREKWLKSFTKPTDIDDQFDEETGELIMGARKIFPPAKTGGQSLIVSIK